MSTFPNPRPPCPPTPYPNLDLKVSTRSPALCGDSAHGLGGWRIVHSWGAFVCRCLFRIQSQGQAQTQGTTGVPRWCWHRAASPYFGHLDIARHRNVPGRRYGLIRHVSALQPTRVATRSNTPGPLIHRIRCRFTTSVGAEAQYAELGQPVQVLPPPSPALG